MPAIIHAEGLFNGDRLRRCSNAAQLHFPRLLLASDGFGRLELNYARIIGRAYVTFNPIPSETELQSWMQEYIKTSLLFVFEVDGQLWGQWDTKTEFLPRYKTSIDKRSPIPPEPAFTDWKRRYREECKAFPKSFRNLSETFLREEKRVEEKRREKTNAHLENNAHVGQLASIYDPPFGTDLDPLPEERCLPEPETGKQHNSAAAKNGNGRAPELASQQEAWFKAWWAEYWHKRAKKAALYAFRKHVKTEEQFHLVLAAMRAQKPEMLQREPVRRPYGATWLNGERWEDELQPAASTSQTTPPRVVL
jgi:hypothetical protein